LNAIDDFSKARDLVEERTTILLADFDAETRFKIELPDGPIITRNDKGE
jgi:hypothetical protein